MTVLEAPNCVAYHFKQKYSCIARPIMEDDPRFDVEYLKRYTLKLADKADKTKKQREIKDRIEACQTTTDLLNVVNSVISAASRTIYNDYR